MGKTAPPEQPAPYRDEPDYAETASMSSAVLLDNVDYPDEDLPSYEDTPSLPIPPAQSADSFPAYSPPPALPFSSHDLNNTETRTRFPNYSTNADQLYQMLTEQAASPPTYLIQLHGQHSETRRDGKKDTTESVTDFYFRINITNTLGGQGAGKLESLLDNKRGYRGTRLPSLTPSISNLEGADDLRLWCEHYVSDSSKIKSFTLARKIRNHDTKKLEQLIRSAIAATNYRGHLSISFPVQEKKVIVYSPGVLNQWRITVWIRWLFYFTFLWIFAWPILFFLTSRHEVVKCVWDYADGPNANDPARKCKTISEAEWIRRWERAVQRAALARLDCSKSPPLDEEWRRSTERAAQRERQRDQQRTPSTGNTAADGAIGFLGAGLRLAGEYNDRNGWGRDC